MVSAVVEGALDEAVIRRLCNHTGIELAIVIAKGGRTKIESKVKGYFLSSRGSKWFVLADLDADPCPTAILKKWKVPSSTPDFACRFAVREVESWLLADKKNMAKFMRVKEAMFPIQAELVIDPKRELLKLAQTSSLRRIREDFLPGDGSRFETGPGYSLVLSEFVQSAWSPDDAAEQAPSLARALNALRRLA